MNPYREEDRSKSTGDFEINNMEGLAIMNFQSGELFLFLEEPILLKRASREGCQIVDKITQ
ncbi:hypothetical protein ACIQZG_04145 [Lysinibacillus sp. NPDC096418]|uniref:hypothetical protein n=1 Tax=Lysinibacillus sp. NPDC096418 TaxID=3364138 RepID=UPI003820591C